MSESTAIERREHGDALSTILGTGDTRAALAQVERNVRDVIAVARERGFVTHYVNENKKTGEIREADFYGFPTWQLLGMTYGVTPVVDSLEPIDGGWKAHAVAQTRDVGTVGGAFGLCLRKEPGKQYKSDHDLAAMAQTRAQRNALRGAMGAALVLAGFDFPDPDAPATKDQIGMLHQLEREIGWSHDQGHVEAGDIASYKELSREEASVLIDRWTALRDGDQGRGDHATSPPISSASPSPATSDATGPSTTEAADEDAPGAVDNAETYGEGVDAATPAPGVSATKKATSEDAPATSEAWTRAPHDMGRLEAIKLANKLVNEARMPGPVPKKQADFTGGQLAKVAAAWRDGERG